MSQATNNLASLSSNSNFRQNIVEESFKELGRRIERGAYYDKGRKDGKEEGKIEGKIEGEIEGLGLLLQVRFGELGLQLIPKIRTIQDLDKLNSLLPLAMNAQNIQELEHGLASFLSGKK
ncbi:MAG: hypothetical protein HUU50_10760 [Candidatus Brocadiae bacterium]|nr:hypothetical protein [Candidatus Brocadiia bacterium]